MKLLRNAVLALTLVFPGFVAGEETKSEAPQLSLELNATDLVGETCRLTFLLRNNLEVDVEQFTVETVERFLAAAVRDHVITLAGDGVDVVASLVGIVLNDHNFLGQ